MHFLLDEQLSQWRNNYAENIKLLDDTEASPHRTIPDEFTQPVASLTRIKIATESKYALPERALQN